MAHFPSLWTALEGLASNGRLISPEDVLEELSKQDDEVHAWCKARRDTIFVPLDAALQNATTDVLRGFPTLVDASKGRGRADPFVIALGKLRAATVVTHEERRPTNPRIPDACIEFGIDFCKTVELIRDEGWTF
jgi:hypothetical protein